MKVKKSTHPIAQPLVVLAALQRWRSNNLANGFHGNRFKLSRLNVIISNHNDTHNQLSLNHFKTYTHTLHSTRRSLLSLHVKFALIQNLIDFLY